MERLIMGGTPTVDMATAKQRLYGGTTYAFNTFYERAQMVACSGIFKHLYFKTSVAPGAGKTWTITVWKNNAATNISTTISGATDTTGMDFNNTFHVVAGDQVCLSISGTAGITVGKGYWSLIFESDKPNEWPLMAGWSEDMDPNSQEYNELQGGHGWASSTTWAAVACPISGKIKDMYVYLEVAPGAGTSYTFELYKNGIATALAVTISDANRTGSNTSDVVSVVPGDLLMTSVTPSAADPAIGFAIWGYCFVSDVDGWSFYSQANQDTTDTTGTTEYARFLGGGSAAWTATEANTILYMRSLPRRTMILKNLYVELSSALAAGKTHTYTIRKNGAAPTDTLTFTINAAVNGNDTTHTVRIDEGDYFDLELANNSPLAKYAKWSLGSYLPPTGRLSLYKRTPHVDRGIGLKRHPRSRAH